MGVLTGVLTGVLLGRVALPSRRVGVRSLPGVEGASACSRSWKVKGRHVFARARRIWLDSLSVIALGCTIDWLYNANSLWESIRVVRLVVGHGVLCNLSSLRTAGRKRGEGKGAKGARSRPKVVSCRAVLFFFSLSLSLRISPPTRDQVSTGNATVARGIDDVVVIVVGRV